MEQDSPPAMSRQVLNAHVGLTNVIESAHINDIMCNTFKVIKQTLEDHCGPYGKYAMVTDPTNPIAQPAFTKDGINIIRAMEFISPIERYVKNTVAYIGSRVERAAGDGSTSSMLIMTTVLESLREYVANNATTYGEFVSIYKQFENNVLELLEQAAIKIDQDTTPDKIRAVVFNQAATSSHGDTELSKLVAELYSSIPQRAWDHITFFRRGTESNERIALERDPVDFTSRAQIYENTMFNTRHGDGFALKDVELYVASDQLIRNSEAYNSVLTLLKEVIADTSRRVVICAPVGMDVYVRNEITALLYPTHTQGRIAIFSIDTTNPRINDLTCLMAICGEQYPYEPNYGILRRDHVNVEFKDFTIKITGLIERTESDTAVSPLAQIPDSPVSQQLALLDECITAVMTATDHTNSGAKQLKEYKRMYNNLLLSTKYSLVIGGSAYDNEAMVDVVEDALKASREALRSGVVLGGYATLKGILYNKYIAPGSITTSISEIEQRIAKAFYDGIDEVQRSVFKYCPSHMSVMINAMDWNDRQEHVPVDDIHHMLRTGGQIYDVITESISSLKDITSTTATYGVIVQPVAVDKSLIQRLGEVALKFLFTNRIIIPGGVVVKE